MEGEFWRSTKEYRAEPLTAELCVPVRAAMTSRRQPRRMEFLNSNGISLPARSFRSVAYENLAQLVDSYREWSVIRFHGNVISFPILDHLFLVPFTKGTKVKIPFDNEESLNLKK